jgi:hypothetical protein
MTQENPAWKEKWKRFVIEGHFDAIPKPEGGYQVGEMVTDRDGILGLVRGFRPNDKVVFGLDRNPHGGTQEKAIDDIRPSSDVTSKLIQSGIILVPKDRRITKRRGSKS